MSNTKQVNQTNETCECAPRSAFDLGRFAAERGCRRILACPASAQELADWRRGYDSYKAEKQRAEEVEALNRSLSSPLEVMTEDLCRIESRRLLLQGELKRLEDQARLLVGCPDKDGSTLDIAVFNFIYSGASAESLVTAFEETTLYSMA